MAKMGKYESLFIVNATLETEAIQEVVARFKSLVEQNGTLESVDEWGKRKLAYEIQKQTEAYYFFIPFDAEPTCPNELEKNMRIMDNVLRYLIVAKDEDDTFSVTPEKEEAPAEEAQTEEAPVETVEENF